MATAAQVIAIAASQNGVTEQPPGSNQQKYGAAFGMNGTAWCAIFVWWCFMQAGVDLRKTVTPYLAYCPTFVQVLQELGYWHNDTAGIQPGDIKFYCWDGSGVAQHTGIHVETIVGPLGVAWEGNTSNGNDSNGGQVEERERMPQFVIGYGRVPLTPPGPPIDGDGMTPDQVATLLAQTAATNAAVGNLNIAIRDPTTGMQRRDAASLVILNEIAVKLGVPQQHLSALLASPPPTVQSVVDAFSELDVEDQALVFSGIQATILANNAPIPPEEKK